MSEHVEYAKPDERKVKMVKWRESRMKNVILFSFFAVICLTVIVLSSIKNTYYTFM
ncbi:hypothetical protein [Metabacillus iocasae]|uniref:Uncharacterized protein n=1 Tax=Priestia iocasae TaxID=2291674 RepID=A0ABS2QUY4_9BACI|nr:hypothetical protein [Metabacillus iocasae]